MILRAMVGGASAALTLAWITPARAHDPTNPEAHRSMPNQVTAAVTVVCQERLTGKSEGIAGPGSHVFSSASVPCIGASISFARELGRSFDLRLRVTYEKPFADNDVLRGALHELFVTFAPEILAYRLADAFTLTVGPEVGLFTAFLTESAELQPANLVGWTVGANAGFRAWVTYHTGFFAEIGAGLGDVRSDDVELRSTWLGRVSVGWADRF